MFVGFFCTTYRESNADCRGEGAGDELSLVKLHQQRRLPHSTVPDKDCLQENTQLNKNNHNNNNKTILVSESAPEKHFIILRHESSSASQWIFLLPSSTDSVTLIEGDSQFGGDNLQTDEMN